MPWSPTTPELITIDDNLFEGATFNKTISYTGDIITYPSSTWTVSITPSEVYPNVTVTNSSISGYYTGVFPGLSIQYLDDNWVSHLVYSWGEVVNAKEIISYTPSRVQSHIVTYTATATRYDTVGGPGVIEETMPYTITVCNNWAAGQAQLKAAVQATIARRT